jgi:flavin-dependent dehydrogenase
MGQPVDVLVIGAGPAGATVARRAALDGHSVLLLQGHSSRTQAGTLSPSSGPLFEAAGIAGAVAAAGFYPSLGSTRWWGRDEPAVEQWGRQARAFHLRRSAFDALLVDLARQAGAAVQPNSSAPSVELDSGRVRHDSGTTVARFVVDASGRNGMLARQIQRQWDPRYQTMGMCALLHSPDGWPTDPHHSLSEAHAHGWAWSMPLADDLRYVCLYVDTSESRAGEDAFRAGLARTAQFGRLFADSRIEGPVTRCDASLYHSDPCAGANWMLVGDAACFVDTLSWFGVEKAIASALNGASAIHECLAGTPRAAAAIDAFNRQERATWTKYAARAAALYGEVRGRFDTPFWNVRSQPPVAPLAGA